MSANLVGVSVATSTAAASCEDGWKSLSEEEWKLSPYFIQMKAQVRDHWKPAATYRQRDPTGARFGKDDRYTEVRVRLRKSGSLASVVVERSSGLDWLDDLAVESFKAAQPFTHPPCQLVKPSGLVDFTYGFLVNVSALLTEIASTNSQ
jgi:TonB family protein